MNLNEMNIFIIDIQWKNKSDILGVDRGFNLGSHELWDRYTVFHPFLRLTHLSIPKNITYKRDTTVNKLFHQYSNFIAGKNSAFVRVLRCRSLAEEYSNPTINTQDIGESFGERSKDPR